MKKILYIIPIFLMIFVLASCFDTNDIKHENHDYVATYDDNYHFEKCECGEIKNKVAHELKEEIIKESTCNEQGQKKIYCDCGYSKIETLPLAEHKYGNYTTTTNPTCTSLGRAERVCEVCGNKDYKDVDKIAHTPVANADVEADCQHEGYTGGTHCSVCNQELEPATKTGLADHEYTEEIITKAATYNSAGEKTIKCAHCTASITESIPRLNFTPLMVYSCLSNESFVNKTIEGSISVYSDDFSNHYFDFLISNNGNMYYAKIMDSNTGKIFEYYTNKIDTISTLNDGFKHSKYHANSSSTAPAGEEPEEEHDENDMYYLLKKYIMNAVHNAAFKIDKLLYDEEHNYYYSNCSFGASNYKNIEAVYNVSIAVNDDGSLKEYATMGNDWYFQVFSITDSSKITMPNAKYHSFVSNNSSVSADGSINCECCNACYKLYQASTNKFTLYYYQNIYDKTDIQFEYKLNDVTEMIDNAFYDVTFVETDYDEYENNSRYKHFRTLYYEGTTARVDHPIKSFFVDENDRLIIIYEDGTDEKLLLMNDGTCLDVKATDGTDSNSTSNYLGKYFDLIDKDTITRYYIKSSNTLEIYRYKELNIYFIDDDMVFTDFNSRKLFDEFDVQIWSWNGKGVKPDGTNDYICAIFDDKFNLEVYYKGVSPSTKAFATTTFQNIEGYMTDNYTELRIYFRGDNDDYCLEYKNRNIIITKV